MTRLRKSDPVTINGHPIDALAFAPSVYRRELAETLDLLPAPDQIKLVKLWVVQTGAIWNPPAALGNAWGPLEGELSLFGVTAFGDTLDEAITSWIKHVRRSDQAADDDRERGLT